MRGPWSWSPQTGQPPAADKQPGGENPAVPSSAAAGTAPPCPHFLSVCVRACVCVRVCVGGGAQTTEEMGSQQLLPEGVGAAEGREGKGRKGGASWPGDHLRDLPLSPGKPAVGPGRPSWGTRTRRRASASPLGCTQSYVRPVQETGTEQCSDRPSPRSKGHAGKEPNPT